MPGRANTTPAVFQRIAPLLSGRSPAKLSHRRAESAVMSIEAVLLPLFVQVALTFALMLGMMFLRTSALLRGDTRDTDIALREPNWPARVLQVGNAYHNELELPLLFYVLTILSVITRHADLLFVLLAWVFVVLRLVRAYIHVTDNRVSRRGIVFLAGAIVLAVMWAVFIVRILLGLP